MVAARAISRPRRGKSHLGASANGNDYAGDVGATLTLLTRRPVHVRTGRGDRRSDRRESRLRPDDGIGRNHDKGYGFILTDGGVRVYSHRNAVHRGLDFEQLTEGQRIGLNLEGGLEGPQATVVLPAPPDAPTP